MLRPNHIRRVRRLAVIVVSAAGVGCRGDSVLAPFATRDVNAAVQTDALGYRLTRDGDTYDGRIDFEFTNRSTKDIAVANCLGGTVVGLEKLVGATWVFAYSPPLLDCLGTPIIIPAGGTYRSQLLVRPGRPGTNTEPKFSVRDVAGVYRLVWGSLSYVGEPTMRVPDSERTSNRFTIAAP